MDKNVRCDTSKLLKYIPFIDYILHLDPSANVKFKDIHQWILNNRSFRVSFVEKMEQAIEARYRRLVCSSQVPSWIINIFASTGGDSNSIVVISDDEDDDVQIIDASVQPAPPQETIQNEIDCADMDEITLFTRRNILENEDSISVEAASISVPEESSDANINHRETHSVQRITSSNEGTDNTEPTPSYPNSQMWYSSSQSIHTNSLNAATDLKSVIPNINLNDFSTEQLKNILQNIKQMDSTQPTFNHMPNYKNYPSNYQMPAMPNGRINLKDPRINKMISGNSRVQTQQYYSVPNKPKPQTYGEYKRTKELERKMKEGHKTLDEERKKETPGFSGDTSLASKQTLLTTKVGHTSDKCETIQITNKVSDNDKKLERTLKGLECTVNGFNNLSDYVPKGLGGKRRSSISARSAIASQLSGQNQDDDNSDGSERLVNNKSKNLLTKRRSSICARSEISRQRNICVRSTTPVAIGKQSESADISKQNFYEKRRRRNSHNPEKSNSFKVYEHLFEKVAVLKLHRLPASEIEKYTDKINEKCPIASKQTTTRRNRNSSNKIPVLNTDSNMTERNTKLCIICKSKPNDLNNHFIRIHKTESYIARLTMKELEILRINIPFAIAVPKKVAGFANEYGQCYNVNCFFCKQEVNDDFINFYNHFSTHTGEYAFSCSECKLQKPSPIHIKAHQLNAKQCRSGFINILYLYPQNRLVIYLYSCSMCGFVQLNEANVFKHLREQHNIKRPDQRHSEKVILAAIRDEEEIEHIHMKEANEDFDIDNFGITVSNEPILDDIFIENKPKVEDSFQQMIIDKPSLHITSIIQNYEFSNDPDSATRLESHPIEIEEKPDCHQLQKSDRSSSMVGEVLEKSSTNSYVVYKSCPKDVKYLGLFKCMADECVFDSDEAEDFIKHFNDHRDSESPPDGYLNCAYCKFSVRETNSSKDLICHIKKQHLNSIFQCNICCYRSCHPGNVIIHYEQSHGHLDGEKVVYKCFGSEISEIYKLPQMLKSMSENVVQLNCNHCGLGFFAVESMKKHLLTSHNVPPTAIIHFKEFACIYCSDNLDQKEEMQIHLALRHPDQFPYVCRRVFDNPMNEVESVHNLSLKNISTSVPGEYIKVWMDLNDIKSENDEMMKDSKPNKEALLEIQEESIKVLLTKVTLHTGVPPDVLYTCAFPSCGGFFSSYYLWKRHMTRRHHCIIALCPHCTGKDRDGELSIEQFESHFKRHCRHTYLCFHCEETFVNEMETREHVKHSHAHFEGFRFEKFKLNLNYSYFVLVENNLNADRLTFCIELYDLLTKRMMSLKDFDCQKFLTSWEVPVTASWMESFPCFAVQRNTMKKCFDPKCAFRSQRYVDLFIHMKTHKSMGEKFKCSKCDFATLVDDHWNDVENHYKMHTKNLFICCVCLFYHYDRQNMSQHCRQVHDLRDVPIVSLLRNNYCTRMQISVVFRSEFKSFSTMQDCFCCSASNLGAQNYLYHLKNDHYFKTSYACELCGTQFDNLRQIESHFQENHSKNTIKICCHLASCSKLSIKNVKPLQLCIENSNSNSDRSNSFKIKEEILNDSDDLLVLDEDDIIVEQEVQNNLKTQTPIPKIQCIKMQDLLR